ncbi:hypothetical protein [Acidiphilium sp.]|uniref:hypothetical protein n=1 Tax=Acidiphilium sp. TaxID=527 RepID=UPI002585576B|nr:hypothetical protein [Acidiphilium sp.]
MEDENDMPGGEMEGDGDIIDAIGDAVEKIIGLVGEDRTLSMLEQMAQRLEGQAPPNAAAQPPARPPSPFDGADPMTRALMG